MRWPYACKGKPYGRVGNARPGAAESPCHPDDVIANTFSKQSPAPSRRLAGTRGMKNRATMTRIVSTTTLAILTCAMLLAGCGRQQDDTASSQQGATSGQLTPDELKNGIGPIRAITLDAFDEELAEQGEQIFTTKCSACHKFGERYVGPDLADVLSRRSPEFVMNMMLNPAEMVERHPEVKALLAKFLTPMPNQNLTEPDARAVLEYFREKSDSES